MRTFLRGVAVILGVILLAPVSTYAYYLLRGFHVGVGTGYSAKVSNWIVENGHSVEECYKIRISPFALFPGPESHTLVSGCIMGVARKAKDPSACELLMPDAIGWECLQQSTEKQPCLFDFQTIPQVRGNGISAPLDSCNSGTTEVKENFCCVVGRSVFLDAQPSCDSQQLPATFSDQCYFEMAKKERKVEVCSKVSNANLRRACEVGVAALL
jgi:hypothetical protein